MNARFVMPRILGLLFLLSLAAIGTAAGQLAPSTQVAARMVVTAVASKGSDVPAISRDDVMVREGKDRDKVLDWVAATGDHAGLEFFLMIDDSAGENVGSQLEDLRKFILAQPASTKVGVAYMQNGNALVLQEPTADHQQAAKTLRLPTGVPGVNASPYFSLSDLIKRWPASPNRREVLMITSGVDAYWSNGPDDPYVSSAIDDAQRAGVIVFSIYNPGAGHFGQSFYRGWYGQMFLSQVSERTGGESYYTNFSGPAVSFSPYLNQLAERLLHQYWLAFAPKPRKKAGLQAVKVMTEVPNAELVAADRVWVPATPGAAE
jgi:hypothetical protein